MIHKSAGPISVLAEFPIKSRPGAVYQVLMGEDGVVYCDCPSWKFQPEVPPEKRTCKHIRLWRAEGGQEAR
jgi:hypothetical protein